MGTKTFNLAFLFKKVEFPGKKMQVQNPEQCSDEKHASGYEKGNSPSFPQRKTQPLIKMQIYSLMPFNFFY